MKDKKKIILSVILFGSIWGGLEAIITSSMAGGGTFIPRSVMLALVSLLVLSYARFVLPRTGSTLAIGLIAAGFKFLGLPTLFMCQLAAVLGQAIVLEIAFTLAQNRGWFKRALPLAAVVIVASYVNSLSFSFSQAYLFQNHWWLDRGISGLLQWSFGTGSAAALASVAGFGIALWLSKISLVRFERFVELRHTAFARVAVAISACFWVAGALLMRV
jgi:hypothetical protein